MTPEPISTPVPPPVTIVTPVPAPPTPPVTVPVVPGPSDSTCGDIHQPCCVDTLTPCPASPVFATCSAMSTCEACGNVGLPACGPPEGMVPACGPAQLIDESGLCQNCGMDGEPVCPLFAAPFECFEGLVADGGVCSPRTDCGLEGLPCCNEALSDDPPCFNLGRSRRCVDDVCIGCGLLEEVPCFTRTDGQEGGCSLNLTVVEGLCQPCGGAGQVPCTFPFSPCAQDFVVNAEGLCVPPPPILGLLQAPLQENCGERLRRCCEGETCAAGLRCRVIGRARLPNLCLTDPRVLGFRSRKMHSW